MIFDIEKLSTGHDNSYSRKQRREPPRELEPQYQGHVDCVEDKYSTFDPRMSSKRTPSSPGTEASLITPPGPGLGQEQGMVQGDTCGVPHEPCDLTLKSPASHSHCMTSPMGYQYNSPSGTMLIGTLPRVHRAIGYGDGDSRHIYEAPNFL